MEIEKFRKCSKKFDSCSTNNFVFYGSREISRDQKFEMSLNWAKNHFMTRDREVNDPQIKYILSNFLKIAKSSNSN